MTIDRATAQTDVEQVLLDSLLYAVSHDLRSPLLTMTLSAELLETSLGDEVARSEAAKVAFGSMQQGAQDLERMLQTLTLLSRARRKQLEPAQAPLKLILGGYEVTSDTDLSGRIARIDPLQVREMLDAVAGEADLEVRATMDGARVDLEFAVPELEQGPSPLHAVAGSLKQYAGTTVETLAVGQVLLERQGGAVRGEPGRVVISLPLEAA
ncbi:MAG: hypothetical protein KC458_03415 [Dehalococcoidia bacterium]|nr:hypothetical protein [Dehalococcoidia bacterium]MCA9856309.1 hypothetical protein [Dehalococcoidia bacterium]MCB9490574.1 hypothetical protein [Dehalococcoidia bacterium]